jgi:hypothetical protein
VIAGASLDQRFQYRLIGKQTQSHFRAMFGLGGGLPRMVDRSNISSAPNAVYRSIGKLILLVTG